MAANYILEDKGYTSPCWIWQGASRGGYGLKSNPAYSRAIGQGAKMIGAHVYYYEQKYGPKTQRVSSDLVPAKDLIPT
jgi:hypothetical protein